MKKYINYYYNIDIDKIKKINSDYSFYYKNEFFIFKSINIDININKIIKLNNDLNNTLFNKIILNKDNSIITYINDKKYILYKIFINLNKKISLQEINYINNIKIYNNEEINWYNLWINKIDNLEYQINQSGKKHPLIVESFSYFIGLSENAISYLNNTIIEENKEISDINVLSHFRINNIFSLYDPINIIFDHKSRDLSEYIKLSFFNDNKNIYKELDEYFKHNYYSKYAIRILFARTLFPSFYFDLYDEITINNIEEKKILNIINNIDKYELYLLNIYKYLNKFYKIPNIKWLEKINQED